MIGMPPATLASKAMVRPCFRAAAKGADADKADIERFFAHLFIIPCITPGFCTGGNRACLVRGQTRASTAKRQASSPFLLSPNFFWLTCHIDGRTVGYLRERML